MAEQDSNWHPLTANDIVPLEYQNTLMYWRDQFRSGYFYIGDCANLLCDMAKEAGYRVTQQDVYDAVGKFCGKSGRTVRYYAEIASFYLDDGVRAEYDMCAFSQFAFAKTLGNRWKDVLEYAKLYPGISAEGLRFAFTYGEMCEAAVEDADGPESLVCADGVCAQEPPQEPLPGQSQTFSIDGFRDYYAASYTPDRRSLLIVVSEFASKARAVGEIDLNSVDSQLGEEVRQIVEQIDKVLPKIIDAIEKITN